MKLFRSVSGIAANPIDRTFGILEEAIHASTDVKPDIAVITHPVQVAMAQCEQISDRVTKYSIECVADMHGLKWVRVIRFDYD